eukprot:IDg16263t1
MLRRCYGIGWHVVESAPVNVAIQAKEYCMLNSSPIID